jgi:hypothetical protein
MFHMIAVQQYSAVGDTATLDCSLHITLKAYTLCQKHPDAADQGKHMIGNTTLKGGHAQTTSALEA